MLFMNRYFVMLVGVDFKVFKSFVKWTKTYTNIWVFYLTQKNQPMFSFYKDRPWNVYIELCFII